MLSLSSMINCCREEADIGAGDDDDDDVSDLNLEISLKVTAKQIMITQAITMMLMNKHISALLGEGGDLLSLKAISSNWGSLELAFFVG